MIAPMKILILGGTAFLGPEIVEAARAHGHVLTLFNRGKTNPGLFPDIEKLRGDRNGDLKSLEGRSWDAVIDTSGYVPRHVRDSARLLSKAVGHYVFISTVSVSADFKTEGMDESAPVGTLPDPTVEQVTGETYGPLKALCEKAAEEAMPGRVANVRPGLIVGPGDPTDRFTYWPVRVAKGGDVLAPGNPDTAVQFIDVRDLAAWSVKLVEDGHAGGYNAVGPKARLTMQELLHGAKVVSGSDARFTWVPDEFLLAQSVGPWMELPLWVPLSEGPGFAALKNEKAVARGLEFRPAGDTLRDTLAWNATRKGTTFANTLKPDKEQQVLAAWRAQSKEPKAPAKS